MFPIFVQLNYQKTKNYRKGRCTHGGQGNEELVRTNDHPPWKGHGPWNLPLQFDPPSRILAKTSRTPEFSTSSLFLISNFFSII